MKKFLLTTALVSFAVPVAAADLPSSAPPPAPMMAAPPPYNWTGFYAGGHIDWSWGHDNFTATDTATGAAVSSGSSNATTFHGGGQIGYDLMFPSNIVIGASAALNWGNGSSGNTTSSAGGANVVSTKDRDDFGGSVDARLGYAFGDLLPYATGGWSWTTGNVTRTQVVGTTNLATPGTSESSNVFRNGWNLGAGLEYRLWRNWTVFGEYRYTSFGSANVTYPLAGRAVSSTVAANSVALGVNYRF